MEKYLRFYIKRESKIDFWSIIELVMHRITARRDYPIYSGHAASNCMQSIKIDYYKNWPEVSNGPHVFGDDFHPSY